MRAILLAAGRGKRMRPLSDVTPKPLLKVGKYRLIEYHLHALARADVKEIVINAAHLPEQFPQTLGDGQRYGVQINYSFEPEGGLETGGGVVNALPLLGKEPFLVINADIWTDYPFEQLHALEPSTGHVVLVNNPEHNTQGDFSIKNGQLDNQPINLLTYSGIGLFHPHYFSGEHPKIFSLAQLLRQSAERNNVSAEAYHGQWFDVGTPERLLLLDNMLNTNKEIIR